MAEPYNIGVVVGADIDPLKKGLREGSNEISGFSARTTATLKTAAAGFALVGAAAAAAGSALIKLSADSAAWADDISNLSKRAGTSAESFQELAFAARSLGIEQTKLSDIFRNSQKNLGEFALTGGGPLKKFFQDVIQLTGQSAESFRDLSGPEGLQKFYDGLVAAKLPQDQIISQLEKLAAGSSALIPLLQNGGQGFADLAAQARDAGIIISEEAVTSLASLDDQFQLVTEAAKSVGITLANALSPEVSAFTKLMTEAAAETTDLLNSFIEWRKQRAAQNDLDAEATEIIENQSAATEQGTIAQRAAASAINDRLKAQEQLSKEVIDLEDRLRIATEMRNMSEQAYVQERMIAIKEEQTENQKMIEFLRIQSAEAQKILDLRTGITAQVQAQAVAEAAIVAPKSSPKRGDENEFQNFIKDPFEAGTTGETATMDQFDIGGEDPFATQQELFKEHWEEMNAIAVAGAGGVAQLIAQNFGNAAGSTAAATKSMFESFSQNSRKMFEVNKAWGIADAIISTAQGIAAGVKLGWPLGIPAVAWAVANGAAQISRIRSTQFGGGGGSAPTATSAPGGGAQQLPTTNNQGGNTGDRTLLIQGVNPSSLYTGGQLENLAGSLEQFWNDGGGKGRIILVKDQ